MLKLLNQEVILISDHVRSYNFDSQNRLKKNKNNLGRHGGDCGESLCSQIEMGS